jgi:type IV pilus assembly protein PilA
MKVEFGSSDGMKKPAEGFTVIELMIVITIVSILAVIALPAYQDYALRSKVAEGVGFLGEAKTSVTERYYKTLKMPTNNNQAGLMPAENYAVFDFVQRLEVGTQPRAGTIVVTFDLPGTVSNGKKLQLVPDTQTGEVIWTCEPTPTDGIKTAHAPANCRG